MLLASSDSKNFGIRRPIVVVLHIKDGKLLWSEESPGDIVDYGLAVDRDGRIMVTLKGGRIVCFGESD